MSHAVKRIKADIREMTTNPSDQYVAEPLEDNMFEWHFTLRGPPGTDFEGGVYHGRILLPAEYPMKPPNIVFLTPNGRFQVGKKICLSISAHHPEHWQPAWGIRLILEALISFFPTEGKGAIGSLEQALVSFTGKEDGVKGQVFAKTRSRLEKELSESSSMIAAPPAQPRQA